MPRPPNAARPDTSTPPAKVSTAASLGPNPDPEYARLPNLQEWSSNGENAFLAIDSEQRVVAWSRGAEMLLGRPSSIVLGRRCFDVLAGNDVFGNRYCVPSCPLAFQARMHPAELIRPVVLEVPLNGGLAELRVTTRVVPGKGLSRPLIVHGVHRERKINSAGERNVVLEPTLRSRALVGMISLTPRERDVLACLAAGLTTGATAARLFVSFTTVRNHIANILQKLEVHTRAAAVAALYEHRLAGFRLADGRDAIPPRKGRPLR